MLRLRCVAVLLSVTALAAIVSGCGGGAAVSPVDETISDGLLQMQVASTAGFKRLALVSPSASETNFIAYYGARITRLAEALPLTAFRVVYEKGGDLWTCEANGSGATNLTNTPSGTAEDDPSWSPDGTRICYRDLSVLLVMNADGSGKKALFIDSSGTATVSKGSWFPTGSKVAFSCASAQASTIYSISTDGTGRTTLATNGCSPAVSPDGRQIVFCRGTPAKLYVMPASGEGTGATAVATGQTSAHQYPRWSGDGRNLYFLCNGSIYTVAAAGGTATRVCSSDGEFCVSPAGGLLYPSGGTLYARSASGSTSALVTTSGHPSPDAVAAAATARVLVGPAGADGGANPPLGTQVPLAVVSLAAGKLARAATVVVPAASWSTVRAAQLNVGGSAVVALDVSAASVTAVKEDAGRGIDPRVWSLSGTSTVGQVTIIFSAEDGTIATVLASADSALAAVSASTAERLVIRGDYVAAYDGAAPQTNRLTKRTREVELDARTGRLVTGP